MFFRQLLIKSAAGRLTKSCIDNKFHQVPQTRRMSTDQASFSSQPMRKSIVAVAQMRATKDKADNMRQVEELVAKAKAQNAQFLFLPECCDFVADNVAQTIELSEPLTGDTVQRYRELAKKYNIWLSFGGIHECIMNCEAQTKTDKIYNSHVLMNDCGEVVSLYRKLHLFDVNTPKMRFRESEIVTPGPYLVPPVSTPIGNLGLQICYDLRFAESGLLLRKAGAEILTYPSAFAYHTGKVHWEVLLRARAIETQCFVLAPAQVGFHNEKRQSYGHAMVVDPWGKILVDCGPDKELDVATVEIDLDLVAKIREGMPCFKHRRDNIYSLVAYGAGQIGATEDQCFSTHTIRKETVFFESKHCFAFTNLRCVVTGHVLVATKRICQRLCDLTVDEMSDLFATVCKLQKMLETFYNCTSATVTVQDGPDAGQTVPHVHFHILPRRHSDFLNNDEIYLKMDDRCLDQPDRSMEERIKEAQKYRDFLEQSKKL